MESRSSFTAETVALQRAFEPARPPGQRLFCDHYAVVFLRPALRVLAQAARVRLLRWLAVGLYDAVAGPGPRRPAVARTSMFDEHVAAAACEGRQCVLLGAGFDMRAHRTQALAGRRVFEVDHPATQAIQCAVVDWLGLPGSCLVLTYVDRRAMVEPSPFPEARRWVRAVARAGEPRAFGLLPGDAVGFFAERGFRVREDVSTYDAGRVWFTGRPRRETGSRLYRITVAEVVGGPSAC